MFLYDAAATSWLPGLSHDLPAPRACRLGAALLTGGSRPAPFGRDASPGQVDTRGVCVWGGVGCRQLVNC